MVFETIKTDGLAHLSYVVGDVGAGCCVVVDPRRDAEVYLAIARQEQLRITHILETHVHADFVSGSRELAERTGAVIYGGASDDYGFEIEQVSDGDEVEVGPFRFRVLHTPGHSPEHVCYVLQGGGKGAEDEWAVFTGDTLFAGEVGRPDLADGDTEDQARALYRSLYEKLLALPDGMAVYPAHGEGSPCGASIGARDRTTIGYERRHNAKLQCDGEDAFVEAVLDELEQEPFYYERMKRVNAEGPTVLGMLPHVPTLNAEAFREAMEADDVLVVDTREIEAFAGAHIAGALSLALRTSFPVWAGWMLDPETRLLLVCDRPEDVHTVVRQLVRTGYERIAGVLKRGMRGWVEAGLPFEQTGLVSVHELKERIERGPEQQLIDVRKESEWEAGRIPTARHHFAAFLPDHLGELDRDRPTVVYCGSGYRASIAASVLQRHGFADVSNVPGSYGAWKEAGYEIET